MKYVRFAVLTLTFLFCVNMTSAKETRLLLHPHKCKLVKKREGWGSNFMDKDFWAELWNYVTRGHGRYSRHYVCEPNPCPHPLPNPDPIIDDGGPNTVPAPEPCTLLLLGAGAAGIGLGGAFRRKK